MFRKSRWFDDGPVFQRRLRDITRKAGCCRPLTISWWTSAGGRVRRSELSSFTMHDFDALLLGENGACLHSGTANQQPKYGWCLRLYLRACEARRKISVMCR